MADKLRITFELELADNPPLYQELSQFPKGARRTSRLRTLAHAGLIAQANSQAPPPGPIQAPNPVRDSQVREASLELFGPPSAE